MTAGLDDSTDSPTADDFSRARHARALTAGLIGGHGTSGLIAGRFLGG